MTRRGAVIAFLLISVLPSAFAADPIRVLARKLNDDVKRKGAPLIAVLNFPYSKGRISTGSFLISERLVTYLVQEGATVIERRLIQQLMQERRWLESGVVSPGTMRTLGQLTGVEAVAVGTLEDRSDTRTEVIARVVRVDTGEVLAAASMMIDRAWRDSPKGAATIEVVTPVPAAYPIYGETSRSRQRMSDGGSRGRYAPAPVPVLMPSVKTLGGLK